MRVFIHTGTASVDNGAIGPINVYFNLAKAVGVTPDPGQCYGSDSLEISDEDWPIAKELLDDAKMLYRVQGVDEAWQNVLTDTVRQRLPFQQLGHVQF
jgi:hypothetical protein